MGAGDDLLSPDEIEALLRQAQANVPPAAAPKAAPAKPQTNSDLLDPSEIEALMGGGAKGPASAPLKSGGAKPAASPQSSVSMEYSRAERLISQAEADLAAAIAPNLSRPHISSQPGASAFEYRQLGVQPPTDGRRMELDALQDVELDLRIELGRTELLIEEVLALQAGTVVPLDKLAGDPVDIIVNGRLIARGEVLVLNDNFCVRVSEIINPAE